MQRVVAAPLHPAQLTTLITGARSAVALQRVCEERWGQLDKVHVSAALTRLAHMAAAEASGSAEDDRSSSGKKTSTSSSSSSINSSSSSSGSGSSTAQQEFSGRLLARALQFLPTYGARQLANTLWAVAQLRLPTARPWRVAFFDAARRQLPKFEPQHISNTVAALAELQWRPPTELVEGLQRRAAQQLPAFKPQELAVLTHALAGLHARPPERAWLQQCLGECRRRLPEFKPQELSMLAVGLARLHEKEWRRWPAQLKGPGGEEGRMGGDDEQQRPSRRMRAPAPAVLPLPPQFAAAFLDASGRKLPAYAPQALSNTLWALARLGVEPGPAWLDAYWRATAAALPAQAPQGLSNTLWAAARLGARPPPPLLRTAAGRLRGALPYATAQEMANGLWGLARLRARLEPAWFADYMRCSYDVMGEASGRDLACMLSALLTMRVAPGEGRLPWGS